MCFRDSNKERDKVKILLGLFLYKYTNMCAHTHIHTEALITLLYFFLSGYFIFALLHKVFSSKLFYCTYNTLIP